MSVSNLKQDLCFDANNILAKHVLIYFSSVELTGLFARPHQLAKVMCDSFDKVVFVQPSGLRSIRIRDFSRVCSWIRGKFKGFFQNNQGRAINFPADNIRVCSPSFIPFNGKKLVDKLNGIICYNTLKPYLQFTQEQNIIFWVSAPFPFLPYFLSNLKQRIHLIYDLIDDYRLFHPFASRIFEVENMLIQRSDMIFTSSLRLRARAQKFKPSNRVALLPNGVDPTHWKFGKISLHNEFLNISKPIIGYFGNIAAWMDIDLVYYLTKKRKDWQFVFLGPVVIKTKKIKTLFALPNVHFLGPKPYARLPSLASNFDVCWIPFKMNSLTETINPIKVYEYLALGKQVVAPPLPDLLRLEPYVTCVNSVQEYETAIDLCLKRSDQDEFIEGCKSLASKFSWASLWNKAKSNLSYIVPEVG